jgi:hypothetical protein
MKPAPPPQRLPSAFVAIAGMGVALLLGFFIGRISSPSAPTFANPVSGERSHADTISSVRATADETSATAQPSIREMQESGRDERAGHASDPVSRLRAEKQSGNEMSQVIRMLAIIGQLSEDEIPSVLEYASGLSADQSQQREIIFMGALMRLAQFNPAAAAEYTRNNAAAIGKGRNDNLISMVVAEWAASDRAAARAWIDQLADPAQKAGALRGYFMGLAQRDPNAAFEEFGRLPDEARDDGAYRAIFRAWSSKDPRAAAQAAANLSGSDGKQRGRALMEVVQVWTQQAPREALAWLLQLPKPEEQSGLISNVFNGWVQREPEAAISQLVSLPENIRDNAARNVVELMAQKDPEEARRIAEQLPPGKGRERALAVAAAGWANRDPGAAAEFARSFSEGAAADAWPKIASAWTQRGDPSAVAGWIAQLPEGPGRNGAVRNVIDQWAKTDPTAAAQWLERFPAGPTRDVAAATFATQVRGTDPASAMEWAATVGDLNQREAAVRQVLEIWRRKDPAGAKAWLQNTNVIGSDLRSVLLRAP